MIINERDLMKKKEWNIKENLKCNMPKRNFFN